MATMAAPQMNIRFILQIPSLKPVCDRDVYFLGQTTVGVIGKLNATMRRSCSTYFLSILSMGSTVGQIPDKPIRGPFPKFPDRGRFNLNAQNTRQNRRSFARGCEPNCVRIRANRKPLPDALNRTWNGLTDPVFGPTTATTKSIRVT